MGAWGPGLYSNDIAQDLKGAVRAMLQSPLSLDEVVASLLDTYPNVTEPGDEEASTFWLVVANQLVRAGQRHEPTFSRALDLIENGGDAALMAELDMSPADLRRRQASLQKLADQLRTPFETKARKAGKPGKLLFRAGDLVTYPTWGGRTRNPWSKDPAPVTLHEGEPMRWSAFVVTHALRAWDFVPVYIISRAVEDFEHRPGMDVLIDAEFSEQAGIGTLKLRHAKLIEFETIGHVDLDPAEIDPPERAMKHAAKVASMDLSLTAGLAPWVEHRSSCTLRSFTLQRRA